jgi:uncharacterized protein (DUF1501 family)
MDEPMVHTRRTFLQRGLALLSTSATVPAFLDQTAWALGNPPSGASRREAEKILVVLQLAGGNDGLNTVIPYRDDGYYQARPRLSIARETALRLTDDIGLHPAASGLKQLHDDGLLAIVQGVGYPNPNRSHFVSTDIWASGDPTGRQHDGWLGRYFDCTCKGNDPVEPRRGIAITQETPLAMQGRKFSPVTFGQPEELAWRPAGNDDSRQAAFDELNDANGKGASSSVRTAKTALNYLRRAALDARASADEIQDAIGSSRKSSRRGRGFGRRQGGDRGGPLTAQLEMVRRMIGAGLPTKVYYVSYGGFDTHAGQLNRHQRLIDDLATSLQTFTTGLKSDGLLDRVLLMTFSEFGRRVAENGSQGTDHGAAAPLFLIGGSVKPGLHGKHPSLRAEELDQGDLRWSVDFRSIYGTVLKDWLDTDPQRIISGSAARIEILTA